MQQGFCATQFLSTPSARRATSEFIEYFKPYLISIHALREEGDCPFFFHLAPHFLISIHALREEGDALRQLIYTTGRNF